MHTTIETIIETGIVSIRQPNRAAKKILVVNSQTEADETLWKPRLGQSFQFSRYHMQE